MGCIGTPKVPMAFGISTIEVPMANGTNSRPALGITQKHGRYGPRSWRSATVARSQPQRCHGAVSFPSIEMEFPFFGFSSIAF